MTIEETIREIVRDELAKLQSSSTADVVVKSEEKIEAPDSSMSSAEFLAEVKKTVGAEKERKDKARTLLSEQYGKSKFTDVDPELYDECLEQLRSM